MPLRLICPSCGANGQLPDAAAGRTARCPKCGTKLVVPLMTSPSPADDLDFYSDRGDGAKPFNPFDDGANESLTEPQKQTRRYTGGFNPFGDDATPDDPPADVEDPFDYTADEQRSQAESFEFGPMDVFSKDHSAKKKRRRDK